MNYIDVLPKMDASVAAVSRDFMCPDCIGSGVNYQGLDKPRLIGWCDTEHGFMMIVECPRCFEKYRFHGTTCTKDDDVEFEYAMRCYIMAGYFSNTEDLIKLRGE